MLKDSKTPYVFLHWDFLQLAVNFFLTFGVYFNSEKAWKVGKLASFKTRLLALDKLGQTKMAAPKANMAK